MDPLHHWSHCWSRGQPFVQFQLTQVVDYNAGLPAESAFLYYHTNKEKQRMFPTDLA